MKKNLKKLLPAIIIGLAGSFVCICCALTVIPAKGEKIMKNNAGIVRFRVVANSDSVHDTQMKFMVRDGLEDTLKMLYSDCSTPEEIKRITEINKELLENTAEDILQKNGESMEVKVRFVTEKAPARRYEGVVFPAGEYMTLRVDIGNAKGHNWWCVMYPSSYLKRAFDQDSSDISTAKNNGTKKTRKIRFALLDLFS